MAAGAPITNGHTRGGLKLVSVLEARTPTGGVQAHAPSLGCRGGACVAVGLLEASGGFRRPSAGGGLAPVPASVVRGLVLCVSVPDLPLPPFGGRASFALGPTWIIQDDPISS